MAVRVGYIPGRCRDASSVGRGLSFIYLCGVFTLLAVGTCGSQEIGNKCWNVPLDFKRGFAASKNRLNHFIKCTESNALGVGQSCKAARQPWSASVLCAACGGSGRTALHNRSTCGEMESSPAINWQCHQARQLPAFLLWVTAGDASRSSIVHGGAGGLLGQDAVQAHGVHLRLPLADHRDVSREVRGDQARIGSDAGERERAGAPVAVQAQIADSGAIVAVLTCRGARVHKMLSRLLAPEKLCRGCFTDRSLCPVPASTKAAEDRSPTHAAWLSLCSLGSLQALWKVAMHDLLSAPGRAAQPALSPKV